MEAGPTLAERSDAAAVVRGGSSSTLPRRCRVLDPPMHLGRWPGVLLSWERHDDGGWRGRVIYASNVNGDPGLVEAWLPAEHLRPS